MTVGTVQSHPLFQTWLARVALKVGIGRFVHPLRRLWVPVPRDALVLEVGSGNNPYPRSDVLLDISTEDYERSGNLVIDRPLVLGLGECLPFRDHSFDFVIASHVLEHSPAPRVFLDELQRVAKAGYIETPEAFIEHLNPWSFHRSEVTVRNGRLIVREKVNWKPDPVLTEAFLSTAFHEPEWKRFIRHHPWISVAHYHWQNRISYEIIDEGALLQWEVPINPRARDQSTTDRSLRIRLRSLLRWILAPRKTVDLLELLRCVDCHATSLVKHQDEIICTVCGRHYPVEQGVPCMFPLKCKLRKAVTGR